MTKQQIRAILDDLYAVDGNLRQYEKELEKIILKILEYKPEVEFDENFRLELRTRLLAEAERLKKVQPVYGEQFSVWRLFTGKFVYAGILGTILILVAAGWFANKQGISNLTPTPKPQVVSFQKTTLKENAFGSLFSQGDGSATAQDLSAEFGRGGGGSASTPATPQSQSLAAPEKMGLGNGGGGGVAISGQAGSSIGMPYYIPEYKFVYKGGEFDLPGEKVEVLRRKTGLDGLGGLESILNTLGMGLIDLSSFGSLKLQNLTLSDESNLGYLVNIDFQNATISVSENWSYWEPFERDNIKQLQRSDIPPDEKLIEITNNFLRDHGVSTQNYGQPEVDNNFRVGIMEQAKTSADIALYPYIQDVVQVIYPFLINGQMVYDESGNKNGLYVSINLKAMKVSGLGNLTSQSYESSIYDAQTDKQKIISAAENGGVYGQSYYAQNSKVVEVELGAPQLGYSNIWNYQNGKSTQLLVPALIFPITKVSSEISYFYQKNIIIPLAKEFFDRNNDIPVPLPMPLEAKPAQ